MIARVAWHADSYDPRLASIRFRLLAPLAALRARGVAIERYDPARGPAAYDVVIFSKSQSAAALGIAQTVKASGGRVVYDLCDNLFVAHRAGHASAERVARVRALLGLADAATFATAALEAQIAAELALPARCDVVPDVIQLDEAGSPPTRAEHEALAQLDRFLARHPGALHCVWFGKSLGRMSGYVHLARAAARLAALPYPATLTVISNARLRFWLASRRWRMPFHYLPWRLATFAPALARHQVAVIPVEHNAYTAGKTMNRPAVALLAGLGVVADALPSYEELRPFVFLDRWPEGLGAFHTRDASALAAAAAGRAYVADRYGADAVADHWLRVLTDVAVR